MTETLPRLSAHALVLALLLSLVQAVTAAPPATARADYEAVVPLTFPFDSDVAVRYVDDYDFCRSGCVRRHQATDLMVAGGTHVHAVVGGTVVRATGQGERPPSWGYALRIRGDDGRTYSYLHLGWQGSASSSAYAPGIREGVRVERGDHIGYAGCSGSASCGGGEHLHLEIRDDRVRDPYSYHDEERMNGYWSLSDAERRGDYPDTLGPFDDVPGTATFADAIARVAEEGVTEGCTERDFCPGLFVTRAQTATFVVRLLEARDGDDWQVAALPADHTPPTTLTDVDDDGVHADSILALSEAGVAEPCDADRYCPLRGATRAELAVFLARALDLPAAENRFTDVPDGAPWAADVAAVAAAGITRGCGDGTGFCPDERVTRGQFAAFLTAALDVRVSRPAATWSPA